MIPIPLQTASDAVQLLSIESVSVIGLLVCFGVFQVWQNHLLKEELKGKDEKIEAIVKEHHQDLKEGTKDAVTMINKYNTFVQQLTTILPKNHGHI